MGIEIRLLRSADASVLECVADGVFDETLDPKLCADFLADPRHHITVALDQNLVVGFASAVDYIHPDKPVELWINEVGVSDNYQRSGIGRRLVQALLQRADELGCQEVWVTADKDDTRAKHFYSSLGGEPDPLVMYTFYRGNP